MRIKTSIKYLLAQGAILIGCSISADGFETALDESFSKLEEAVPGKFNLNARLRYEETVDTTVGGSSLRLRYGYTTPSFNGLNAMIEGESLARVGSDPWEIHPLDNRGDETDLNQAWLQFADKEIGSIKVGRQIYALDDHRFIGHVGWRQNIQTFDAATFTLKAVESVSIKGFYLKAQNSVFGAHNELDSIGFNILYTFSPSFKIAAFYYNIEGDDVGNANASNTTLGFRSTGAIDLNTGKLKYALSYAEQKDTGPSSLDYDASYFAGDFSGVFSGITFGAGFEILEPGFRTPLATVHKFNGFADALLPLGGFQNGLEDTYVYAAYKIPLGKGLKVKIIYHWFDSESGGAPGEDGGEEFDLVASYKFNKYLTFVGKYGDYSSSGGVGNAGAADKEMFTLELNFAY